jgi:hypothetical protein
MGNIEAFTYLFLFVVSIGLLYKACELITQLRKRQNHEG